MNIAILGSRGIPANYSGVEEAVEQLAKRLAQRGHKLIIYCRPSYINKEEDLHKNIKPIIIPTLENKYLGTFIHVFLSTIDILFRKIDVVHFNALGPSFFSFLTKIYAKKTVVTVQGLDWQRKKWGPLAKGFLKFCEYAAIYFPDRTIVVSRRLKKYFENKFGKEVYYIPNGVEIHPDLINPDEYSHFGLEKNQYILFVGRLVPEKNIELLITAFNQIKTKMKLAIVGLVKTNDKYVRSLMKTKNLNIKFLPFIARPLLETLYRGAYIFVLPSSVEGMSLALLEAMSYGKCALTSDIPECLEAIEDAGMSFKLNDSRDLAEKMKMLIDNPALVKEYGIKARATVALKYNWETITDEIERLYYSLVLK